MGNSHEITPGIYRINSISHIDSPFLGYQEKTSMSIREILEKIRNIKPSIGCDLKQNYYPSIDEFLDAWMRGYKKEDSELGTEEIGFELLYVNLYEQTQYFNIIDKYDNIIHTGVSGIGKLNPLIICADLNGLSDGVDYMNLGVNDFRSGEILVYRGEDDSDNTLPYSQVGNTFYHKSLRDDICYHLIDGRERFPFTSPNPLKAVGHRWHMIGLSPEDVYSKIEKLGFVWPN